MTDGAVPIPARDRELVRHLLAALAYRAQKALRGAPEAFRDYRPAGTGPGALARTPGELVAHMASLMGYAVTFFDGGSYPIRPERLDRFEDEIARFHGELERLATRVAEGRPGDLTTEQLIQGPIADALTHAGQLAYLRRLFGAPVPPENFIHARVSPENLGPDQPLPAAPDADWPEAPEG